MMMTMLLSAMALSITFAQSADAVAEPTQAEAAAADATAAEAAPAAPPTREELVAFFMEQGETAEQAAESADVTLSRLALESSLTYRQGDISLAQGRVTLSVPSDFRYLGPADADKVLVAWGNPPSGGGEGLLLPADIGPFETESWAVILTYTEDGHVEDDDASEIDYDELLEEMREEIADNREARLKAGYGTVELLGWAEAPRYDPVGRRLYWAKHLRFNETAESINYDVRVLGRRGVLSMSAVASPAQLALVKVAMEQVLTFAEFNDGHRYADFDPDLDEVAAYGIGALVAGKLATKAGLFKGLLAILVAGKKAIPLALVALAAGLKNLFSRRGGDNTEG
ncbi:MAG: hypothetical protein RIT28_3900 [Pseudomonadota bacterium]